MRATTYPLASKVERVLWPTSEITEYLQDNLLVDWLALWDLEHETKNLELFVSRDRGRITGHLAISHTPEADYTSMSSEAMESTEPLLELVPAKCVLIVEPGLYKHIKHVMPSHLAYPNDRMMLSRGQETLASSDSAVRLSVGDAPEYMRFGASFNAPRVPLEWAQERLQKDIVFGVFSDGSLVSIASLTARFPLMAVIAGVETHRDFRGRGYATAVTSAATREALKHSESCSLFVRSDNPVAIHIYGKLGYKKIGEELWIDVGTGLVP